MLSLELIISHYQGKTLPSTLPSALWIVRLSNLVGGQQSRPSLDARHCCFFPNSFPCLRYFHAHRMIITLLNTEGIAFMNLWGPVCVQLPPLWYCHVHSVTVLSQFILLDSGSPSSSTWVFPPCTTAQKLSQASKQR